MALLSPSFKGKSNKDGGSVQTEAGRILKVGKSKVDFNSACLTTSATGIYKIYIDKRKLYK